MPNPDALERAAAFLREYILESHAEKHAMEQTAVETALDAAQQREGEHRTSHIESHAAHEKIHDVAAGAHREQHEAEFRAVSAAVEAMDRRLGELNKLRDEVVTDRGQFVRTDTHQAGLKALEIRIDSVERLIDKAEGAVNTWRWIAGFLGLGGVAAIAYALTNTP